ncbi:GspH/FimT family pseudopilin [Aeromonas encheleia]|uniref:GspH/FimT family pseudopilin n=1 Tax=Aeromonas TaxID=642 RepID=UPI001C45F19C|nr:MULTISPECIES: GspH/FimT family pseudopilin [Aeromonas]MBV7599291.1 GspH/FimT family pseudopilin [Aeromonas sp. sia0103]UNP88031.1 GspH/FimT family pseudopilin [Aeromonas encheleia]
MVRTADRTSGFTLIELLIALTLVAILVAVALPSYQSLRQEQMVRAATQALYTDVMLLKSEAVKRNQTLNLLLFNSGTSNWCYRVHIDGSCSSCTDTCSSIEGRKGGDASEFPGLILEASYSESATNIRPLNISPRRGTLTAGNIAISSGDYSMRVVTNNVGRVRTCAVRNVSGVPGC